MDDEDIRAALRRGATDVAFRLVLQAHRAAVYSTCCRMLKDRSEAEDVMQQVLIAAFKNHSQLLEVDQLRGWLIRIATRKCIDALRTSKRHGRHAHDGVDAETVASASGDVIEELGKTEKNRALEQCLAALAPGVAAAVRMRHHERMSWEQIAETVAMPLDTIRMRVRRALKSLRKCLESKGIAS